MRGYAAVDLSNYRRIRSQADFVSGAAVVNLLYVHSSASGDPYLDESEPVVVARVLASDFTRSDNGGFEIAKPVVLPAGRYICSADFSAGGSDNEVFGGVEVDGSVVVRYHTYTRFLADSYRDWVFTLRKPARVSPYLRFLKDQDETLDWRGVEIARLPQFDRVSPPVVD